MIGKSTIAAAVLVTIGVASPAFAQAPYYYDYAGPAPYAYAYPYAQPAPFGWAPYGYGYSGWAPGSAPAINYNVHTPPNH